MKIFKTLSSILVTSVLSVTVIPQHLHQQNLLLQIRHNKQYFLIILMLKLRAADW